MTQTQTIYITPPNNAVANRVRNILPRNFGTRGFKTSTTPLYGQLTDDEVREMIKEIIHAYDQFRLGIGPFENGSEEVEG